MTDSVLSSRSGLHGLHGLHGLVAYTTGTYDLVHSGHFNMLEFIRTYGYERIIIGLVTDEFATLRKRKTVLSYEHRRTILENSKYNVFVVPCTKSDKILDYKKLKFDALFITDEYFECEEYSIFSKEYPFVPVYYAPRVPTGPSTTKLIKHVCNNIEYIDSSTISIHGQKIQIIQDLLLYNTLNHLLTTNIANIANGTNGTNGTIGTIEYKYENIWWWYLPQSPVVLSDESKENFIRLLDKWCITYKVDSKTNNFGIRETVNSWEKYKSVHLSYPTIRFPRSEIMAKYYLETVTSPESINKINTIKERLATDEKWLILPNDYPYDTPMGVDHFLFWFTNRVMYTMEEALEIVKTHNNVGDRDVVIFCNTPENKSILDINHYHLLSQPFLFY